MHTTLSLSSNLSQLIAGRAAAVKDINHPPRDLEFPPELLELRRQILDVVDREGLVVISRFTGDYDQVMVYLMIDNRRVVHGRTPFSPTFSDTDRHLKRILGMRRAL